MWLFFPRIALVLCAALVVLALLVKFTIGVLAGSTPELLYYAGQDGDFEIYRLDVDRGLSTNLTHNPGEDGRPVWSPDGQHIAFYSHRNFRTDLYIMTADGKQARRVTDSGGPGAYPAWSPDGEWIAFASLDVKAGGIYRVHPDGTGLQYLSNLRTNLLLWSPDSQRLLFTSNCDNNCDIYLMNADGSGVRRLTHNGEFDVSPVWSLDGQHIAFMSNRDNNLEVYVMEADCDETFSYKGCDAYRLTNERGFDGFPDWSPDGKQIVFSSDRDSNFELYSLPADCYLLPEGCSSGTRLTDHSPSDVAAVWSPDSRQLAFMSGLDMYVMNADGGGIRRLARSVSRGQTIVWRPQR